MLEISRSHAMTAGGNVIRSHDARVQKGPFEILAGIGRRFAIEGNVTSLCCDDNFVSLSFSTRGEILKGKSDRSFAALESIIDGTVEDVYALFDGMDDGLSIIFVGLCVC